MADIFSRASRIVRAHRLLAGAAALLVIAAGWYAYSLTRAPELQTLAVHPAEFLQQVSVSGKVVAAHDVDLGFPQSGRVSRVYVKVGDRAGQGALLAEVENADLRAAVLQKQAALETQRSKLLALEQGTRPEQLAVTRSKIESSEVSLVQADAALVDAIRDAYTAAESAVHNKLDQIFSTPRTSPQLIMTISDSQFEVSLESDRLKTEALLSGWQRQADALTAQSDLVAAAAQAQANLSTVGSLLGSANAALNRAIADTSNTQAEIDGYITDTAAARTSVNTANSDLTAALTARKNAATALETAKRNLSLEQAGSTAADVAAQQAQVKAAQADVASAQAQLAKTMITAPFSGVITAINAKAGANVTQNGAEISMIDNEALQIESYVPEINIALLSVGDGAEVTLDAYGSDTVFPASVVSLDPAETIRDGVSTYRAVLQFTERDARVKSGMTANVVITTARIPDVLSVPQGIIFEKNGREYVRVVEDGRIFEREVTTDGVSSAGNIRILTGLTDGDVVVLTK